MMSVFANEGDSDGYDETCASLERGRMVEKLAMDALEQAVGRGTRLIHVCGKQKVNKMACSV